jgi:hypothetical protein
VLQPVIHEYIVERIVESVARELASDQHNVVRRFPAIARATSDMPRFSARSHCATTRVC